jgi:hypothetical protein
VRETLKGPGYLALPVLAADLNSAGLLADDGDVFLEGQRPLLKPAGEALMRRAASQE